jgi:hypothetical protein
MAERPPGIGLVLDDRPFEVRGAEVEAKVPAAERSLARVHQVWSVTRV